MVWYVEAPKLWRTHARTHAPHAGYSPPIVTKLHQCHCAPLLRRLHEWLTRSSFGRTSLPVGDGPQWGRRFAANIIRHSVQRLASPWSRHRRSGVKFWANAPADPPSCPERRFRWKSLCGKCYKQPCSMASLVLYRRERWGKRDEHVHSAVNLRKAMQAYSFLPRLIWALETAPTAEHITITTLTDLG